MNNKKIKLNKLPRNGATNRWGNYFDQNVLQYQISRNLSEYRALDISVTVI